MSTSDPPDSGKRILLAEDSEDLSLILSRLLESAGHTVICVSSADDVMPALVREQPDLLLLDVMMPSEEDLDGFAICQRIKSHPHHQHLPVVIISAIAEGLGKSAEELRRASGADLFIHKPFDPPAVLEVIQSLLA